MAFTVTAQENFPAQFKHYKETIFTLGYNYNFDGKQEGRQPEKFHVFELGLWKSHVSFVHHPFMAAYYLANDFGINTGNLVFGPKIGGFVSITVVGIGGELICYTDLDQSSIRFIPSLGFFTPYFKLTLNPHVILTNKDFHNFNRGHVNLTIRFLKIKRTNL